MSKLYELVKACVKNEYFILTLILILGFGVRLYKLDNPIADWHSWRQADTSAVSRNFVNDGINLFYPRYDDISSIQSGKDNPTGIRMVEFPVYNALHTIHYKYLNFFKLNLEEIGRLTTALITILTAVFLYLFIKDRYNIKIALFTVFFFLFLPFNIYFSRVILPDPIGVMFAISALYLFKKNILISGILFALALLQKPYLGLYLVPLVPDFLKRENIKRNLLFLFLSFTPFLIWRYFTSLHPEGIPFYKWAFNGDRIRFHPAWFRWLFGERIGLLILGTWGLVPYVLGLINDKNKGLNMLLNLGALFYLTAVATANVRHDYYQILIIPAIALSLAVGSNYLWNKNYLSKGILVLSVMVMFLMAWDRIKPFYQVNHPEIIEVGQYVDQNLPKDAKIIIPYNGDTAFLYQTNRKGWPAVDSSIDNIIERGATHYVSIDLTSPDTINFEKQFETLYKSDKFIILKLQ